MGQPSVQRWRKFGHDRWYVNDSNGTTLGWMDARTGDLHLEDQAYRGAVLRALGPHVSDGSGTTEPARAAAPSVPPPPTGPPVGATAAPPPPPAPHCEPYAVRVTHRDLGGREAGTEVAKQAAALREQAPVKAFAARLLGVHTDERAWRVGAVGERKVAKRLQKLPDGWHALHAIPVGDRGADIDHLVIGPGGVFTINAKHHPDANVWVAGNTFMVNGHRQPYVRNARHEARRASKLLSAAAGRQIDVRGVIAVVGAAKGFTVKEQPTDVRVQARRTLHQWLLTEPQRLDAASVRSLHRVARRSDTWQQV